MAQNTYRIHKDVWEEGHSTYTVQEYMFGKWKTVYLSTNLTAAIYSDRATAERHLDALIHFDKPSPLHNALNK